MLSRPDLDVRIRELAKTALQTNQAMEQALRWLLVHVIVDQELDEYWRTENLRKLLEELARQHL